MQLKALPRAFYTAGKMQPELSAEEGREVLRFSLAAHRPPARAVRFRWPRWGEALHQSVWIRLSILSRKLLSFR